MSVNVGDKYWIITGLYPQRPEEGIVEDVFDDGRYITHFQDSGDKYEFNINEPNVPFVLYDSYETALLNLIRGIYEYFRNDESSGYQHINPDDSKEIIQNKCDNNLNVVSKLFNQVRIDEGEETISCHVTVYSCGESLMTITHRENNGKLNSIKAVQPFKQLIIMDDFVVDPETFCFPITLKKYLEVLNKFNNGKVEELKDMRHIISIGR